jgi:acetylornithine deacetylase
VHSEDVVAGRPNITAIVRGSGSRAPLVLNGHLDTAVEPEGWSQSPYEPWVQGGRIFGGGVTDMKGALASMIAATEAAAEIGRLPGDLVFQAVMHHDGTGLGAKYLLASYGPREGYAICAEPSDLKVHTANAGAVKFEIQLQGRGNPHVSRAEDAPDTIPAALAVYHALRVEALEYMPEPRLPELPRLLIGELSAGSSPAHVAGRAVLRGDIRTVPGLGRDEIARQFSAIVDAACPPEVTARVRTLSSHQTFFGATDGVLVDAIRDRHSAIRGQPLEITNEMPGQAFVTDAADLANFGLETVVYGPGVWRHAANESVAVDDLADAARIYLGVALTLGAEENAA